MEKHIDKWKREAKSYMGQQQEVDREEQWRMCESCGEQTRMEAHKSQLLRAEGTK